MGFTSATVSSCCQSPKIISRRSGVDAVYTGVVYEAVVAGACWSLVAIIVLFSHLLCELKVLNY